MALKVLVLLFLFVSLGKGYEQDCLFHEYSGGPGQVIAKFEPTLPGKVSLEFGDSSVGILSNLIGHVPALGGALSSLFSIMGQLTDTNVQNMVTLQDAINELIDDVKKSVEDLQKYVDAKFQEYDYDKISQKLKGIYSQSAQCSSFDIPTNLEQCLKSFVLDMAGNYPTFLAKDPKYETFEQLLPLARQFVDVQMAALLDILNVTNLDPDYKDLTATFSLLAYNTFVHGINTIVDQHRSNVKTRYCDMVDEVQDQLTPCISISGVTVPPGCPFYYCKTIKAYVCHEEWDNGDGCSRQHPIPKRTGSCFMDGPGWKSEATKKLNNKRALYHSDLETNIRKYWHVDVGQAMEHWMKLGIMAGADESMYLTYSTTIRSNHVPGYDEQIVAYLAKLATQKAQLLQVKSKRKEEKDEL